MRLATAVVRPHRWEAVRSALEIVVEADQIDEVVETIRSSAHTGRIGDGKVWVTPLERVVRVRPDEHGGGTP